jgi:TetR/AcrR family fatty acid metabolism transcriptional regulator
MNRHSPNNAKGALDDAKGERRPGPSRDPEKRARILDAAIRVFARKGFFSAKVAEIAAEAGVADGTIYLYFKNKDDLLISLFEERMDALLGGMRAAIEGVEPGPAKLDACADYLVRFAREHPELMEVFTVEVRQSTKFMKEYSNPKFKEYLEVWAGIIAEGQAQGRFRADVPPQVAARALYGAMDEICLMHVLSARGRRDLGDASRAIREIFIQGLLPTSQGKGGGP